MSQSTRTPISLAGSVPSAAESEQGKGATWYLQELGHGQFQRTVDAPLRGGRHPGSGRVRQWVGADHPSQGCRASHRRLPFPALKQPMSLFL